MTSSLNRSSACDAISHRHLLRFRYTDNKTRVVEPHLVGENTAHHDILIAWRLRTEVIDASHAVGWRNYLLDEMHSLEVLTEAFDRPRPDFNPNDRHILRVYCHVIPDPT